MPVRPSLPPAKKRKTTHAQTIESHEQKLTSAIEKNESLNALVDLISLASSLSEPQDIHKAMYALYRIFVLIIDLGRLCGTSGEVAEAKLVRTWLNERLTEYTLLLCKCLRNGQKNIRASVAALDILFSILKHLSESFSKSTSQPQIHASHFSRIMNGLLLPNIEEEAKVDVDVVDHFISTWFDVHDDIRWFFLREAGAMLRSKRPVANPRFPENVLSILERLTTMPTEPAEINEFWIPALSLTPPKMAPSLPKDDVSEDEEAEDDDDWRTFFDNGGNSDVSKSAPGKRTTQRVYRLSTHQSIHTLASHQYQFDVCWMALLPHLSASAALSTRALEFLHRGVMPHLNKPVRLMDWIGGCVDFGGSVGLLALNALFTLMQEYNLDYPNFYNRLYGFLTRDVLHLKYRARFFRLTELFLSSTHLPATLLASFLKRLSRLSLSAPPAAIVMIIPFTYNVLKRHPACMVMIHRDNVDAQSDPFDANEQSPYLTNALSSSLWELLTHRNHYHAPVASLAKIFTEAFTRPGYAMEDFLDHTYGTLFDTEAKRKIKKEPPLAIEMRKNLFPLRQIDEATDNVLSPSDVICELWTF